MLLLCFPHYWFLLVYLIIKYVLLQQSKPWNSIHPVCHIQTEGFYEAVPNFGSILTAPITVGFGGSVGLEGPTVATGAAISSNMARLFHLSQNSRTLLISPVPLPEPCRPIY